MKNQTVGFLAGIYNEAHRVVECLDWHLPYVNEAVIVIQKSDDGTEEVVDQYIKDHPDYNITALHFPLMGCSEATLQQGADTLKTDWILYVDMDEKFPVKFLKEMHTLVETDEYDGFRFERDNYFDIQVFNEAVPIEPKVLRVKHPARDQQVRLTRKSLSVFPPQVHVRVRVRRSDRDERIFTLSYSMFHLKTLDEQWIDNKAYLPAVKAVEEMEKRKKEAKENG